MTVVLSRILRRGTSLCESLSVTRDLSLMPPSLYIPCYYNRPSRRVHVKLHCAELRVYIYKVLDIYDQK